MAYFTLKCQVEKTKQNKNPFQVDFQRLIRHPPERSKRVPGKKGNQGSPDSSTQGWDAGRKARARFWYL